MLIFTLTPISGNFTLTPISSRLSGPDKHQVLIVTLTPISRLSGFEAVSPLDQIPGTNGTPQQAVSVG